MAGLQAPKAFEPGNDVASSWAKWKQKLKFYWIATDLEKATVAKQRATLLHLLGDYGLEIYNTLTFTEAENARTVEMILDKLTEHFEPYKNETYFRFLFFTCSQAENQAIDQYVTLLKQKATDCGFGNLKETLIRDRIVCGVTSNALREKLLGIKDLDLSKCIDICRADEESRKQVQIISGSSLSAEVNRLKFSSNKTKHTVEEGLKMKKEEMQKKKCHRCNKAHPFGKCPAWGKMCNKCNKPNHFSSCCKARKVCDLEYDANVGEGDDLENHEAEYLEIDSIHETKEVWEISRHSKGNSKEWTENVLVNDLHVKFKLDSGSEANILPFYIYNKLSTKPKILKNDKSLLVYNKNRLDILGACTLRVSQKNIKKNLVFYILKDNLEPILGLDACIDLKLIKRIYTVQDSTKNNSAADIASARSIINSFSDVFHGIGCFPKPCSIKVMDNAVPHIARCRKIPLALHEPVRMTLQKMEKDGIIAKVVGATDWLNAMVVIEKKDHSIRLCIDPRPLNKYIVRQRLELPTLDTIFAQIGQAKVFTVLDASSAFYMIPLDSKSSELCTFITPFGRYMFKRLPYGLSNAPEIFQHYINNLIDGLEGTVAYIDDILVMGNTLEEHNLRLEKLLEKARAHNVKFKIDKLQLAKSKIQFLGHTISESGIEIDNSKIEAVQNMNKPTNLKELQKFLGMINFLSKFIENVAEITAPLRSLLRKGSVWSWEDNGPQDLAFKKLKQLITKTPVLKRFDPLLPVALATDASQYGIGGHISQSGQPIAYWSMSLNSAQRNYAQIEKELLAVVLGCEKFHYYLYGRPFKAIVDHKPLLGLVNKPIDSLSPRLQRLVIRLLKYDVTLEYIPGKELYIPDALSRAPLSHTKPTEYLDSFKVRTIILASDKKRIELLNSISNDDELQTLKFYIRNGWPNQITSVKKEAKAYYSYKDEIFELDGYLFKGNRLIIPKSHRFDILNKLHSVHQGIVSCQKRAQDSVFWPGINEQIVNMVSSCLTCLRFSRSNPKQPLQPHPVPRMPWEKIGADFMQVRDSHFLVVCDYHSKFVELVRLSRKDAPAVIEAFWSIFKSHGLPAKLMTDNGPPFNSKAFASFLGELDISHVTSSPTYSQSNGMIERHIQTLKSLLMKCPDKHPYLVTMEYNSTSKTDLPCPAEMLMGRKFNTQLPRSRSILKPLFNSEATLETLQKRQDLEAYYYDRNKKSLPELKTEPVVMQQAVRKWIPGEIIARNSNPESFIVQSEDGSVFRRNRIHLKKFPQPREAPEFVPHMESDKPQHDTLQSQVKSQLSSNDSVNNKQERPGSTQSPKVLLEEKPQESIEPTSSRGRRIKPPARFQDFIKH